MIEPAVLRIDQLGKAYGGTPVLDRVDLSLPARSITAVIGASGCGKTTLLRLIAGFDIPDAGSISIAGRPVAGPSVRVPPHSRDVGYVAQDGALFPHLTVAQNIAYGLKGGLRRDDRVRVRVAELLQMVSLHPDIGVRRPHELSGGQQQRVALARALARRPVLMLLDEPFSALDTGLRGVTRRAVAKTLVEAGATTLLVTHDQEEALSIADQVAVMRDGRFTQVGTPAQVYGAPQDLFTAAFLGDCVLLPARVGPMRADCVLGSVAVRPSRVRGEATIMLRPGQLVATPVSDDEQATGTVIATEFLGSDVVLTIDLPGDQAPIVVRQTSADPPAVNAKVRIDVLGVVVAFGSGQ